MNNSSVVFVSIGYVYIFFCGTCILGLTFGLCSEVEFKSSQMSGFQLIITGLKLTKFKSTR